ncbi:hypothetical protein ACFYU9_26195 [Streptomyces sp. NPDC004327]|uniref:hypothetical protein n=1 Tax=Streptomyces sp. NPDC004327 TaxID=3364699 RepID=UPI0036A90C64
METHTNNVTAASSAVRIAAGSPAGTAFATVRRCFALYGALAAAGLGTVVVLAGTGHPVNAFMWIRAVLLPLVAVVLHRQAVAASRGARRAYERVSQVSVILPVAIIGVDLIPGICPPWYAATQIVCMLPVTAVAVLARRSAVRAAFAQQR